MGRNRGDEPSLRLPSGAAAKSCRWCAEGHRLINGEHWIVKRIGSITIKPCKATGGTHDGSSQQTSTEDK